MNISELAGELSRAVADRTAITRLSDLYPALDIPTAYRVQRELRRSAGSITGWKLGLTSRAKQTQVGVDSPVYGFLPTAGALRPGAALKCHHLIQPRCEPEIVFLLGHDLEDPRTTASDVLAATTRVAVGIEVLDSRFVDYSFTTADVVADNTSAARYVVGDPVDPRGIDLRLVGVVLEHNGCVVGTAAGAASTGHPAAAVAWLARQLAAEGESVRAGQIVLSGGLTSAVPVSVGDTVVATVDRIGSVELRCA
ncbi:2-keto-4-pentenoate hydratase [Mycolicibacterium sp. CBMA 226]|uniref:2-keto-4-pentenoate hydratase n=1 Tax=Mycolicibacterium sp. CBMA 226 TaxID=2606611 RepID=UPI0012DDDAF0|nr:fumarylacetoacetate hydrolase family protein [Mycolicibacterium sp. CBMA 226]MUL78984.1 4-oxalocrotonate decarboxylase [Mycolicibacterium sp. CBMA 226]QGW61296.1 2-hydroxyhexa-2,4-dienoate hydratase [Mycolicibacterium sp.]